MRCFRISLGLSIYTLLLLLHGNFCTILYWNVSKWGGCVKQTSCLEPGLATRTLRCATFENITYSEDICFTLIGYRPKTEKKCVPQKCYKTVEKHVVKKFTGWSHCVPHEHKLQHDSSCGEQQTKVEYARHRIFKCTIHYGKHKVTLHHKHCVKAFNCTDQKQHCFSACWDKCALTKWSVWKPCPTCWRSDVIYKIRSFASIQKLGEIHSKCPKLVRRKVSLESTKSIFKYQFKLSRWKSGKLFRSNIDKPNLPSFSLAKREVSCSNRQFRKCPLEIQKSVSSIKIIVTGRNCVYSDWTQWSECDEKSARFRYKRIKRLSRGDGKPCVLYRQRQKCREKKILNNIFSWRVGSWSGFQDEYVPLYNIKVFYRKRDVFCVKEFYGKLFKPVIDSICSLSKKPATITFDYVQPLSHDHMEQLDNNSISDNFSHMQWLEWVSRNKSSGNCFKLIKQLDNLKNDTLSNKLFKNNTNQVILLCRLFFERNINSTNVNHTQNLLRTNKKIHHGNKTYPCILTEWSYWYPPCPSLRGENSNEKTPFQYRRKYVLQHPSKFDKKCPSDLVEWRYCSISGHPHWELSPWADCIHSESPSLALKGEMTSQKGFQVRSVRCSNGRKLLDDHDCIDVDLPKPAEVRECTVNWMPSCTAEWSDWSNCSSKCNGGSQTRRRLANSVVCEAKHVEKRNCNRQRCVSYEYRIGSWGPCHHLNGENTCVTSGTYDGIRFRNVTCHTNDGKVVANSYCEEIYGRNVDTQNYCKGACAADCSFSIWSSFSECSAKCGYGVKTRVRFIIRKTIDGGIRCPVYGKEHHMFLKIPCKIKDCLLTNGKLNQSRGDGTNSSLSTGYFEWQPTAWSSCSLLAGNQNCGFGVKVRSLNCVNKNNGEIVPGVLCKTAQQKIQYSVCEVPCTEDCELTTWSTWSQCGKTCDKLSYRKRVRHVVSEANNGGIPCMDFPLEETVACTVYPCYHLKTTNWGECRADTSHSCGAGLKYRNATCTRSDGKTVPLEHCKDYLIGIVRTQMSCNIPCWEDCIVSEWSKWSPCFGVCDPFGKQKLKHGYKVRNRVILQNAIRNGKKCPKYLTEQRRCKPGKCFKISIEEDQSGERQCVRSDGIELSHGCGAFNKTPQECRCQQHQKCVWRKESNRKKSIFQCLDTPLKKDKGKSFNWKLLTWFLAAACLMYIVGIVAFAVFKSRNRLLRRIPPNKERCLHTETLPLTAFIEMSEFNSNRRPTRHNILYKCESERTSGISSADELELQSLVTEDTNEDVENE